MIIIAIVKVLEGSTITSVDESTIDCRHHQLVCIDGEGYIDRVVDESEPDFLLLKMKPLKQTN